MPAVDAKKVLRTLARLHPDAHCELQFETVFQLLCATVLSAQTTDVQVNRVTPELFARYPTAKALAGAEVPDIEPLINRIGMYRQKAKHLCGLSRKIMIDFEGEVPDRLDDLVTLPGVGRKTANVVLGVWFKKPEGVVVDTHVQRIAQRLGLTKHKEPPRIEQDLMAALPRKSWDAISHVLIFHGRRICFARKPNCEGCGANKFCPSAFRAEGVGRKVSKRRAR